MGVVPADDAQLVARARGIARQVITAGLETGDLRASAWEIGAEGRGRLVVEGVEVIVPLLGAHNLRNAMLALAVARACGIDLATAASGIAHAVAPPMRSAWSRIGELTLLNDAYNANPPSMRAALALMEGLGPDRPRVVVLGTMRELGPQSESLHADIARLALQSSFDVVAGVGAFADALAALAPRDARVVTAADVDGLWPLLRSRLAPNAVVLLKASRGVRLERLVSPLTDWATSSCSITS